MQLLNITLYNHDGRERLVEFKPGTLNVVTGESRTGKSALLTIVDYCLGRDTARVPAGPIASTVAWFGTLWQLEGGSRAFLARPAMKRGASSNSQAMLEFGGEDLESLPFGELKVNTESKSLRVQVGFRMGLREARIDPSEYSARSPFSIGLGSAALFCFQGQDEIANKSLLFHRQAESGMDQTIKDALPYFLGAIVGDQAAKRAQLREARKALRKAETAVQMAELAAQTIDVTLQSLLSEANAAGLTDRSSAPDIKTTIDVLSGIRHAPARQLESHADIRSQDARRELEQERDDLRGQVRRMLDDRELLLDYQSGEGSYGKSLALQTGRMTSLDLVIPTNTRDLDGGHTATHCPVCSHELIGSDPTVTQLSRRLVELRQELVALAAAEPSRREALERLETSAANVRDRLQAIDTALEAVSLRTNQTNAVSDAENREFIRGRIDATLGRNTYTDDTHTLVLRRQREDALARVAALDEELDDDDAREQLTSRLVTIGRDMTAYANKLGLEHSEIDVRLDVAKLTVVADTETGPTPMHGIGSAANWIGYHLVTHLALHRFFTRQDRPVPRLLMLDQPTQAYYQSEETRKSGKPNDSDRDAVLAMFRLMKDVVEELAPRFQIIVSDHANLSEDWFADSVVHNWRDDKLIPASWLTPGPPTENGQT